MENKSLKKGFTLIEILVFTALISFVMVAIVTFSINVIYTGQKTQIRQEVRENAYFALERILKEIRNAGDVNEYASLFDVNPGILSLAKDDVAEDPTVFDTKTGNLRMFRGLDDAVNLTANGMEVTNLVFTDLSVVNRAKVIKVELTVRHANADVSNIADSEVSVESTAVIREQSDVTISI